MPLTSLIKVYRAPERLTQPTVAMILMHTNYGMGARALLTCVWGPWGGSSRGEVKPTTKALCSSDLEADEDSGAWSLSQGIGHRCPGSTCSFGW